MNRKHKDNERPDFIRELEARQRNIWMGDQIRNSGILYRAAWHGSQNAPLVQRIGIALFGLVIFGTGVVNFFVLAPHSGIEFIFAGAISGGFVYVGIRLMWNAIRP